VLELALFFELSDHLLDFGLIRASTEEQLPCRGILSTCESEYEEPFELGLDPLADFRDRMMRGIVQRILVVLNERQRESRGRKSSAEVVGTEDDELEGGREVHLLQGEAPWEVVVQILNPSTGSLQGFVAEHGHRSVTELEEVDETEGNLSLA
jgi:hypothetical protein